MTLLEEELLEALLRKVKSAARKQTRARVLLKAAAGCKDLEIMNALAISATMVGNTARPMVCFDESPKQLDWQGSSSIPLQPGTPARQDTEYQRNGVRDLMMICEPKRGWREVLVMERRTKIEFAHCMRHIVQCYPEAEIIRVVLDNLNTHKLASLYEAFSPQEASPRRAINARSGSVMSRPLPSNGDSPRRTPAPESCRLYPRVST